VRAVSFILHSAFPILHSPAGRPLLKQSRPLPRHQSWVCSRYTQEDTPRQAICMKKAQKHLQTLGHLLSTSDTHRHITGITPAPRRPEPGNERRDEGIRTNEERRRRKGRCRTEVTLFQCLRWHKWQYGRSITGAPRWPVATHWGTFPDGRWFQQRKRYASSRQAMADNKMWTNLAMPANRVLLEHCKRISILHVTGDSSGLTGLTPRRQAKYGSLIHLSASSISEAR